MENRIAELKHDLGANHFCLKQFHATEGAFRAVLLLFERRDAHLADAREVALFWRQGLQKRLHIP